MAVGLDLHDPSRAGKTASAGEGTPAVEVAVSGEGRSVE
jgi:hypothetical protein